jgi:hypothetical protein
MTDIQAMHDAREALESAASELRREAIQHDKRAIACRESAAEAQRAANALGRVIAVPMMEAAE